MGRTAEGNSILPEVFPWARELGKNANSTEEAGGLSKKKRTVPEDSDTDAAPSAAKRPKAADGNKKTPAKKVVQQKVAIQKKRNNAIPSEGRKFPHSGNEPADAWAQMGYKSTANNGFETSVEINTNTLELPEGATHRELGFYDDSWRDLVGEVNDDAMSLDDNLRDAKKGGQSMDWSLLEGQDITPARAGNPDASKFTILRIGKTGCIQILAFPGTSGFDWSQQVAINALNKWRGQVMIRAGVKRQERYFAWSALEQEKLLRILRNHIVNLGNGGHLNWKGIAEEMAGEMKGVKQHMGSPCAILRTVEGKTRINQPIPDDRVGFSRSATACMKQTLQWEQGKTLLDAMKGGNNSRARKIAREQMAQGKTAAASAAKPSPAVDTENTNAAGASRPVIPSFTISTRTAPAPTSSDTTTPSTPNKAAGFTKLILKFTPKKSADGTSAAGNSSTRPVAEVEHSVEQDDSEKEDSIRDRAVPGREDKSKEKKDDGAGHQTSRRGKSL